MDEQKEVVMSDYEYPTSGPGHRSIRAANRRIFSRQNLIIAASVIALAAMVLVITWFALGFNVRTEKTCEVINVADTASVKVAVWKVTTSCGTHFINSGDFIDQNDPAQIAASLVDGETYKLTFSGNDHDIVAATPVKG